MLDLILYLFIYSFIGWMVEVVVIAISEHRFANRGILNLPLCLSYGIIMDLLIILTREQTSHGFIMFGICLVVISATEFLAGYLVNRLFHRQLWDYMNLSLFGGRWQGLVISILVAFCFFTFLKLVHPFVYTLIHLLPRTVKYGLCIGLLAVLLLDILLVIPAFSEAKNRIGRFIYRHIRARLDKAYPSLAEPNRETAVADPSDAAVMVLSDRPAKEEGEISSKEVFARGICFDKLVWVFLIFGLVGNLIETVVVRYQTGIWMRRASLIFIPVSVVWGFAGVIVVVVLSHMAVKEDRYVFVGGFLLGGSFEYLCSVFTETFLGTKFWDYSDMPFNFAGRANLLFCFLWGLLAVLWLKFAYPPLSRAIERIPPVIGKTVTFVLVVLLVMDAVISCSVMLRCSRRRSDPVAHNYLEAYIDENYPDEVVLRHWRNIRFDGKLLVNENADPVVEEEGK